jgi:hypothetical protein
MNFKCLSPVVSRSRWSLMAIALAAATSPAFAQYASEMSDVYGRGVHSFFAGQVLDAEQQFSQVIAAYRRLNGIT